MPSSPDGAERQTAPRRTLYVMRHAAAEFDAPSDHARPLSIRGRQEAQSAALEFVRNCQPPQLIICSTALRTRTTSEILVSTWRDQGGEAAAEVPISATDALYEARPRAVLELLHNLESVQHSVLLVGHEPTVSLLTELLADRASDSETDAAALHLVRAGFMTAAIAQLDFDIAWDRVEPGTGILRGITPPPGS